MGRWLGIDFGVKRIGIARSDLTETVATSIGTIQAGKTLEETADKILSQTDPEFVGIVIGLPLLLSGKESEMSTQVRLLAEIIKKKTSLPVEFYDERLSTAQVERGLKEQKFSRKKRAQFVDTLSATLILQSFLDQKNWH